MRIDNDYAMYECTAHDHTYCDSTYCDFAHALLIEDEEGSFDSVQEGMFAEYAAVPPEEADPDSWVG